MPDFVAIVIPLQIDPVLATTAEELKLHRLSNYDNQSMHLIQAVAAKNLG